MYFIQNKCSGLKIYCYLFNLLINNDLFFFALAFLLLSSRSFNHMYSMIETLLKVLLQFIICNQFLFRNLKSRILLFNFFQPKCVFLDFKFTCYKSIALNQRDWKPSFITI